MKKLFIFILALTFLNAETAYNQETFKLSLKQPPLLIIAISEELNATLGQVINLDTLFSVAGSVSYTREWKFWDGSLLQTINNPVLTLSKNGVFYLSVTNENGCTALDSFAFNLATGTEDIDIGRNRQSIHVYPNPNTGTFDIKISDCQQGYSVDIINSLGVQLLNKTLDCNNNEYSGMIMIPDSKSGTYYLLIKQNNKIIYRQKVIILK
jgi:hypothetical protein